MLFLFFFPQIVTVFLFWTFHSQSYDANLRLSDLSHMFRLGVWNIWDWYTIGSAVPKTLSI